MKLSNIFLITSLLLLNSLFLSCNRTEKSSATAHSEYSAHIKAFTSGTISSTSPFIIEFTDSVSFSKPGKKVTSSLVSIEPSLKGEWNWVDHFTIKFTPTNKLPTGKKWRVTLKLNSIFEGANDFFFEVATFEQNYRIVLNPLEPSTEVGVETYKLTGQLELVGGITWKEAESMLSASIGQKKLEMKWHQLEGAMHFFEIADLLRKDEPQTLVISHTGAPIGVSRQGKEEVLIPSNAFSVQSVDVVEHPSQKISVVFSDVLDPNQNLDGLITFVNNLKKINFNYTVQQNILEIHFTDYVEGDQVLELNSSIRNLKGKRLGEKHVSHFFFGSLLPAVEFVGKGNILPSVSHPILHFRAASLKSVIVRVVKIYENNVPHFLQMNTLGGEEASQIKRAGRLVHQEVISLDEGATLNLSQWNSFAIDLSTMIEPDPGAIYRVELGFDQSHSIYPCDNDDENIEKEDIITFDEEFWDNPYSYYGEMSYDYYDWNWRDRDNPCSNSYYTPSRFVNRNILASNLGVLAKAGNDGEVHAFVTSLLTTFPVVNAEVKILNFQMQQIGEGVTDQKGKCTLKTNGQPFLMVVEKEKQRGYLRLDEGQSLSLSKFDVAGRTIQKGIKGFIYGDRGVWRPGDSLFISFMPEDKLKTLPTNHPVTFELIDARGQLVERKVAHHPTNKIYVFKTATNSDAPTGIWRLRVTVGNTFFEKNLRIEAIKPNRLRIDLNLPKLVTSSVKEEVELFSEWLHGASAAGLKARVGMDIQSIPTIFEGYPNFVFDDATRQLSTAQQVVFDGELNSDGKAQFQLKPDLNQAAPGFVQLNFVSRVFEEGGSFSITTDKTNYSPYKQYVGLRAPHGDKNRYLLTDTNHNIEVVTLNEAGMLISPQRPLKYTIYKIGWRWWWDNSDENLGSYVTSRSANVVRSGEVRIVNGKANLPFRIDQPNWGRYLVRVEDLDGGHTATVTLLVDWPGWAQKDRDPDAATMLTFNTDKEKYEVGEEVKVTFPSAENSRALVSLENGTEVINSWWVDTEKDITELSFKATDEMTPNIYISITLLQPYNQTKNDLPIRMYGVIPITIFSPKTILEPQISTPDQWKPMQKASITVSENNRQPMSYTLAVVDEGLLDLTRFKTPNPWEHFNLREALGVKSWDIFDHVLGAYGGRIERMFSIGGDGELINPAGEKREQRFEPMVRFLGPFNLKRGGKNKHEIEIPNYTGSVRVMLVATNGTASGAADKRVAVTQPLMVWSALPRVIGPDEVVALPVTLFATTKDIHQVKVEVKTDNKLFINGKNEQTIFFNEIGEQTIFFELKAGKTVGTSTVEVIATSKKEVGQQKIYLPIRNPHPEQTNVQRVLLGAGESAQLDYTLLGAASETKSTLEFSILNDINFGSRLEFLLGYPHGCIEQIASRAFPQLYLSELSDLSPTQLSRASQNVQEVLNKLSSYQVNSGGFAYWSGGPTPHEWATSYAGHFMLEAELKGFAVSTSVKRQWIKYQKGAASAWVPDKSGRYGGHDLVQAYRLFTLALAGETHLAAMNRLRQQPNLSWQSRWRLAATYAVAGMTEIAKELTQSASTDAKNSQIYLVSYGSAERDLAMMLETLVLMNQRQRAAGVARDLSAILQKGEWMSTQTTAYSLIALSKYAAGANVKTTKPKVKFDIPGAKAQTVIFSKPLHREDLNNKLPEKGSVKVTNLSDGELFVNLVSTGQPLTDATTQTVSEGIALNAKYTNLRGELIDVSNLTQGSDFKVTVTIRNNQTVAVSNLALTQIFPSGWEIRNLRMEESGAQHLMDQPTYQDFRDDRVYTYFDLLPGETKHFVIVLHASYAGKFYLPSIYCQAMYDYNVRALQPGFWVEVNKQ